MAFCNARMDRNLVLRVERYNLKRYDGEKIEEVEESLVLEFM